jgi:hypothetical protein
LACFGAAWGIGSFDSLRRAAIALLLALVGLAVLLWAAAMAHVGVRITAYSVTIRHGLLPVLGTSLPLRTVRGLSATDVQPSVWRRWGWTWVPGRGRAVIVRSGPALAIEFGTGRRFVVTVDDPEQAVAALGRLRAGSRA